MARKMQRANSMPRKREYDSTAKARKAAYRATHKDEIKASMSAYHAAHKDEINAARQLMHQTGR